MMIELNVGTICCDVPTNASAIVRSQALPRMSGGISMTPLLAATVASMSP